MAGRACGRPRGPLPAETAGPLLVRADRPQEVDLAEGRPVGLAEVELAVGALPGQEAGQADLAGGPDDELRVRRASGVQLGGQAVGREGVGQLIGRRSFGDEGANRGARRLDQLVAARVAEKDALPFNGRTPADRGTTYRDIPQKADL